MKLSKRIQQCAELQSEIRALKEKTAYAPPCVSSSVLQETGLETTDKVWQETRVWQEPGLGTVDQHMEDTMMVIKQTEARLPKEEEKASNICATKDGRVICLDSDSDNYVSDDPYMD